MPALAQSLPQVLHTQSPRMSGSAAISSGYKASLQDSVDGRARANPPRVIGRRLADPGGVSTVSLRNFEMRRLRQMSDRRDLTD